MTRKIFRSIMLVAATVLLASLVIVMGCLYDYYRRVQEKQLQDELLLASCAVETQGIAYLEKLAAGSYPTPRVADYRFTWIAADGTVLFDTSVAADTMENHKNRIEVQEAFARGESRSVRYSDTLTERTLYYARALTASVSGTNAPSTSVSISTPSANVSTSTPNTARTVLRISVSQATVFPLVLGMLQPILFVALFAVVLSAVLAHRMARKIVHPLNTLDLDHPLENDVYEELAPLLRRIHQQHQQISRQLRHLREKTDEFEQITGHMTEGLVLLDNRDTILSINPAAQAIFQTDTTCIGREFLLVERSRDIRTAIQTAAEQGHGEAWGTRNGREYQIDVSRIESDGAAIGTVLLAFDVTEQRAAESRRREFTANVSHELKTPLQSITGSAELLENGLVKPDDVPRFIHLIRTEAARLVTLVEDIIHLSQLDEGIAPPREEVDLYETAVSVVAALQGSAAARQIQMTVTLAADGGNGPPPGVTVCGVRSFLYEMLYNLCDNAIKYNREGGCVTVTVGAETTGQAEGAKGVGVVVTVADSGIGIPPAYQDRIFERFFRVDKSRSKSSGGTGLGLSIVKHIAQFHQATVRLRSQVGQGTTVSVAFPAEPAGRTSLRG